MGKGKEISASQVQSLINQGVHPSKIASLDDGGNYFSKEAQRAFDGYKSSYWNSGATATAGAMSGSAPAPAPAPSSTPFTLPPAITSDFDLNATTVEQPVNFANAFAGMGSLASEWGLPTNTAYMNGMELDLAKGAMNAAWSYKSDYGLRSLQGDIDKELARMQYENDQLKTDKIIDNEVWLNRNNNLAAGTQARIASNAQMLSNV